MGRRKETNGKMDREKKMKMGKRIKRENGGRGIGGDKEGWRREKRRKRKVKRENGSRR